MQVGFHNDGSFTGGIRKAHIRTDGYGEEYTIFSSNCLSANKWNMLTLRVSKTNKNVEFFLDGISQGILAIDETIDYIEQTHLRVGTSIWQSVYSGFFKGKIDDIKIFNYAIDEALISELYSENGWTGDQGEDYFNSVFFDFNDNQAPEQWDFVLGRSVIDFNNGRMNGYITDTSGALKKDAKIPSNVDKIIFKWDGKIASTLSLNLSNHFWQYINTIIS